MSTPLPGLLTRTLLSTQEGSDRLEALVIAAMRAAKEQGPWTRWPLLTKGAAVGRLLVEE